MKYVKSVKHRHLFNVTGCVCVCVCVFMCVGGGFMCGGYVCVFVCVLCSLVWNTLPCVARFSVVYRKALPDGV